MMRRPGIAALLRAAIERRRAAARTVLESLRAPGPSPSAADPARAPGRGPAAGPLATPPRPPVGAVREPRVPAGQPPAAIQTAGETRVLRRLLTDPASLGAAFAAAEILGKPVALRDP